MRAGDLQSKIVMLTIAFPRLKLIWSSSPYQTAEIFEELKRQGPEPDPIRAVQIGLDDSGEGGTSSSPSSAGAGGGAGGGGVGGTNGLVAQQQRQVFNREPGEMLRCVPGVDGKVWRALTDRYRNVREVAEAEEGELAALVGGEKGRMVWRFFNRDVFDALD